MANDHGPGISLGMQLEQVKEIPIRLGTLTVHNETEREMEQATLQRISKKKS